MPPLVRFDTRNQPKLDVTTPIMQGLQMKAQQQQMTLQRKQDERAEAQAQREIKAFAMAETKAERDTKVNLLTDFREEVTTVDHTNILPLIEKYVKKGLPRSMFPADLNSIANPLTYPKFQQQAALGTKFFEKTLDDSIKDISVSKELKNGRIQTISIKPSEWPKYQADGFTVGKITGAKETIEKISMSKVMESGRIKTVEVPVAKQNEYEKQGFSAGKITGAAEKPDKPTYTQTDVYLKDGSVISHPVEKGTVFDPVKVYGEGATLKAPQREETTPSEKESYVQHTIRSYGAPRNQLGQIMMLNPEEKKARLAGWFKAKDIEVKSDKLDSNDLERIEQAIMTEIGIDMVLQNSIRAARMAGATSDELIELLGVIKEK